jgi:hemoglobin/transferrin/lactoferrin receptor protein
MAFLRLGGRQPFLLVIGLMTGMACALAEEGGSATATTTEGTANDTTAESGSSPAASPEAAKAAVATRLQAVTAVATRTEKSPTDIPESVAVVDADQIETEQASTLGEVVEHLPGVHVANGPRAAGEAVVIRGLSGDRVLVTVDGVRQNFSGGHRSKLLVDPDLLKQVDVLRGPGSAIWGSGALGGVLALTTKDAEDFLAPDQAYNLRYRQGYQDGSSENLYGLMLAARTGPLQLLADYATRESDDLRQGGGDELPYSAREAQSGLLKLGWDLADGHRLQLGAQRFQDEGTSPSNPSQDVDTNNPLLDRANDQRFLNLAYDYAGSGEHYEGARINVYQSKLDVVEDRVSAPRHDELMFETTGVSVNNRWRFAPLDQRVTAGAEYYVDQGSATRNGQPRPQFPDAEQEVLGVYAQDELQLTPAWSLIPGLRHDRFESASNTSAAQSVSESETSLRLGTLYRVTDWLALNASYGEAFRAPNLTELYSAGTHFLGNQFTPNPSLRPEKAGNRELGFRLDFDDSWHAGDRLQFNASVYENSVQDFIELAVVTTVSSFPQPICALPNPPAGCASPLGPIIGGSSTFINLNDATLKGGEMSLQYELGRFSTGLSYSRTRGTNEDNGEPLALIPADTTRLDLGYQLPWADLRLGTRLTHAASQDRVPTSVAAGVSPVQETSGYTTGDVYAVWEPLGEKLRGLRVNVGIDNVTDRQYRPHLSLFDEVGRNAQIRVSYLLR